jgi:hypothetical protein
MDAVYGFFESPWHREVETASAQKIQRQNKENVPSLQHAVVPGRPKTAVRCYRL